MPLKPTKLKQLSFPPPFFLSIYIYIYIYIYNIIFWNMFLLVSTTSHNHISKKSNLYLTCYLFLFIWHLAKVWFLKKIKYIFWFKYCFFFLFFKILLVLFKFFYRNIIIDHPILLKKVIEVLCPCFCLSVYLYRQYINVSIFI